jgi:phosphoserine aminotransferase
MLNLRWLKNIGGLSYIENQNNLKSKLIYDQIDNNSLFEGTANIEDRSSMNVTFSLLEQDLNETFEKMLKDASINGLKGHRSVGGFRASIYNAMPIESVSILVDIMRELENKKG